MSKLIDSRCTMGAMASKKARCSAPVACGDRRAQARGGQRTAGDDGLAPVGGGRAEISSRAMVMRGMLFQRLVTAAEKPCRSTASAPPAGSLWASAVRMISEPGAAHLFMQQADGVVGRIVGAEGIGADQFGQGVGLVGRGAQHWAAFHAEPRRCPILPPARPLPTRPTRRR